MAARSEDEMRDRQWTARYTAIVLELPDRLDDFVRALQSSDPDAALMALFDCDAAMALQLRRTQFDFLTPRRRAQMRRDLKLLRQTKA
ncbi:hypothetical protein [Promicromonospora sukumoe]|uniref:hypothetical protein n=1 Tax=Promicromonospora sukumoe TaxID=88382 RepID=UPI00365E5EE7